jgi:hypothetical protein
MPSSKYCLLLLLHGGFEDAGFLRGNNPASAMKLRMLKFLWQSIGECKNET